MKPQFASVVVLVATATLILSGCGSSTKSASPSSASGNTSANGNATSAAPANATSGSPAGANAGAATGAAAGPPAGLINAGTFTVCVDIEFPPMEFFANGTSGDPVGFDISVAKLVAQQWGVQARFVNTAFDGLIPGLQSGKCDAVWSAMYINAERQKVAAAVPYFKTGNGVLVPAGNPQHITTLNDLAGKRVAVAAGTDTLTELKKQNETFQGAGKAPMILSQYPRFTEEVGAVSSGKADAMVEVDVSVDYAAKQSPKFASVKGIFAPSAQLGVYLKKGSAVGPAITKALAAIAPSGQAGKAASAFGLDPANVIG